MERYDGDAAVTAASLVEAANQAGGKDNITALFVAGPEFYSRTGATRPRFSTTRVRGPIRALTALCFHDGPVRDFSRAPASCQSASSAMSRLGTASQAAPPSVRYADVVTRGLRPCGRS